MAFFIFFFLLGVVKGAEAARNGANSLSPPFLGYSLMVTA